MSNQHLKLEPHHLRGTSNVWWYECKNGIQIHVESAAINPNWKQAIFQIDWDILRRALKRKDKK